MDRERRLLNFIPLLVGAALALLLSVQAGAQTQKDALGCEGLDYQSTTCARHGDACAALATLKKSRGTVRGAVRSKYLGKYPFVAYLVEVAGDFHPRAGARMDQKGKKFVPRLLPILVGTTVRFHNSDSLAHNVFSPDGEGYDLGTWGKGKESARKFEKTGSYAQLCKLHPEMIGYVVVLRNPYFSVVADSGAFELHNVPPGKYALKLFCERLRGRWAKKTYPVAVEAGRTTSVEVKSK